MNQFVKIHVKSLCLALYLWIPQPRLVCISNSMRLARLQVQFRCLIVTLGCLQGLINLME